MKRHHVALRLLAAERIRLREAWRCVGEMRGAMR